MRGLVGKRVLVSGGSSGIGLATAAYAFLASDDAAFIHGSALVIDGAQLAVM